MQEHTAWLEDEKKGKRAYFSRGDWRAADLHGANLRKAFISVKVDPTELYDKMNNEYIDPEEFTSDLWNIYRSELQGADLSNADLTGADLSGADLHGANLNEADLGIFFANPVYEFSGYTSGYTDSFNPTFNTDLSGADISNANLRNADLTSANLAGADLTDANLSGADLTGANLRGVKGYTPKKTSSKRNSARKAYERGTT